MTDHPTPELDATELDRHIASLPPLVDDPGYLVFADWLQSKGHPWGNLIVLMHRIAIEADPARRDELQREVDRLLDDRGTAVVGELANDNNSRFTWHLGFIRNATVGTTATPEAIVAGLKTLLDQPAARMADGVILHPLIEQFATHRDWDSSEENLVDPWPALDELAKLIPERVVHLGFGGWPAPAATAYVKMPSFTALSGAFPRLRRLELTGWCDGRSGRLQLPELVDLEVRFAAATIGALGVLTASELPKLERLSVWLGGSSRCILDDVYGPDEDAEEAEDRYPTSYSGRDLELMETHGVDSEVLVGPLRTFLEGIPATVQHLALRSVVLGAPLCEAIVRSPVIARLRTLDLSGGTLDDNVARVLVETKGLLAHLDTIHLDRNQLTERGVKQLTAELPNVRVGEQSKTGTPEFFFRYVATME